jgi:hypothetical protein
MAQTFFTLNFSLAVGRPTYIAMSSLGWTRQCILPENVTFQARHNFKCFVTWRRGTRVELVQGLMGDSALLRSPRSVEHRTQQPERP